MNKQKNYALILTFITFILLNLLFFLLTFLSLIYININYLRLTISVWLLVIVPVIIAILLVISLLATVKIINDCINFKHNRNLKVYNFIYFLFITFFNTIIFLFLSFWCLLEFSSILNKTAYIFLLSTSIITVILNVICFSMGLYFLFFIRQINNKINDKPNKIISIDQYEDTLDIYNFNRENTK